VRYKIGELAAMLGIPTETLRFYEQKGLITPTRDESSGYRYFETDDFFRLLIIKSLRGFEFTLSETLAIINEPDVRARIRLMETKKEEFRLVQEKYAALREHADTYVRALEEVERSLWKCRIETGPSMYACMALDNQYAYKGMDGLAAVNQRWLDASPFPQMALSMDRQSFENSAERRPFRYGLAIDEADAERLGLEAAPPVFRFPARRAVHTVFRVPLGAHPADSLGHLFDFLAENGLEPAGDALGHLIYQTYCPGEEAGYFRMWVPVR